MNKSQYSLEVLVNDRPVKEYENEDKIFIEGRKGSEYSLRVRNNNYNRILAVITVDGINVISGKPSAEDDRAGYIVNGYSSIKVQGFRKDLETVGAFKFCEKGNAYSEEIGLKGNTGVIGVRIFDEVQRFKYIPICNDGWNDFNRNSYWTSNNCSDTLGCDWTSSTTYSSNVKTSSTIRSKSLEPEAKSNTLDFFDTGTTWGKAKNDKVTTVTFESKENPTEVIEIYYASKKGLKRLGVDISPKKQEVVFPKSYGNFATPPKGWNG